ncbi:MAG: ABC transporter permease [Vicinamibacteria bacterium]|nr:ABC transporter permease [Vicinamibacteria bacterium]
MAVIAGVAIAVSVLAGALLVGESVRASLRGLVDERLGRTSVAVTGQGFFRQVLGDELKKSDGFSTRFADAATLIAIDASITHEPSGREASRVQVYGIDASFFRLHGVNGVEAPTGRQALLSPGLAAELGAAADDGLLLRVQKPSAIPADTLAGRRSDTSRAVRLTTRETLPADRMGEFTLRPQQEAVRAVFVPIARLQRDLDLAGRANLLLLSAKGDAAPEAAAAERLLNAAATFEDLGLRLVSAQAQHAWVLESETGLLSDSLVSTARSLASRLGFADVRVLTYLANTIRIGGREVPYSVVAGVDPRLYEQASQHTRSPLAPVQTPRPPIWLNAWAAADLQAKAGDEVTLEYYLWSDDSGLQTSSATFSYVGSVPMEGAGGDRSLTPEYPGLTDAPRIGDWDPPFPVDLKRIRPADEAYWEQYRTAPKAFITTATDLWPSPYGTTTSLRIYVTRSTSLDAARNAFATALRNAYTPAVAGLVVQPVRAQALAASRGSTDFGEYFTYFSFFIVVSGLLLSGLFFKLGLEQRVREVGLLFALGFTPARVRRLLGAEGLVLAGIGAVAGMAGAVLFGATILYGLRTWWVDAVGTTRLTLAISVVPLVLGALGGLVAAAITLTLTLRRLGTSAPKDLLSGLALMASPTPKASGTARPWLRFAAGLMLALSLVAASVAGAVPQTAAFFAAGGVLLVALLLTLSASLRRAPAGTIGGHGPMAVARLGIRQATAHPSRSVLSIALIAFATFVIVSVGAFKRGAPENDRDPQSGTGGYTLFAESVVPVMFDPGTPAGRRELGLESGVAAGLQPRVLDNATIMRFRLRPGEDGSCLNLYKPTSPRIVAPARPFVDAGGFRFAASMAANDAERQNPWRLLDRTFRDGAVPVIGDANSLQYVLHVGVGEDFVLPGPGGQPVVLRVVAALSDSLFQSELVIAETQFVRLFPRLEGYRFFTIRGAEGRSTELATALEDGLADYGFDAQSTAARLASYHRVENTYLSTFQALGGLGLLLGTLGLGAILLRNVLERRRELALLQAVGYGGRALGLMVVAESVVLMAAGIATGTLSALVAVAPALAARATSLPIGSTVVVLAGVFAAGLISSLVATRAAAASPLLASLKAD